MTYNVFGGTLNLTELNHVTGGAGTASAEYTMFLNGTVQHVTWRLLCSSVI